MRKVLSILLTTYAFLLGAPAIAQGTELDELLGMDLGELRTVTVASKREERIVDAPGIISVISKDEIRRWGALSLRDIIDRQTSMQITGNHINRANRTSLRGVGVDLFDRQVLILLNGRPIRDAASTGINRDIYAGFPIDSLEKIEFVRGPGSVLYGTNAMAGVINLVTKTPGEEPEFNASVSYGSHPFKEAILL